MYLMEDNQYNKPLAEALAEALSAGGHFDMIDEALCDFEDCSYPNCQYILGKDGTIYEPESDSPEAKDGRPFRIKPEINAEVIADMIANPEHYKAVMQKVFKKIEERRKIEERYRW